MKAFVEVLSAIVRVGPDCDTYGKPYDGCVTVSAVDGQTAIAKALVADGLVTPARMKAVLRALKSPIPGFQTVTWERIPHPIHEVADFLELQ